MKTKKINAWFATRVITLLLVIIVLWIPFHSVRAQQVSTNNPIGILPVKLNPPEVEQGTTVHFLDPELPFLNKSQTLAPIYNLGPEPSQEWSWSDAFCDSLISAGVTAGVGMLLDDSAPSPNVVAPLAWWLIRTAIVIAVSIVGWMFYHLVKWAKRFSKPAPKNPQPPQQPTNETQNAYFKLSADSSGTSSGDSGVGNSANNIYGWAPEDGFVIEASSPYLWSTDPACTNCWVALVRIVLTFTNSCVLAQMYMQDVLVNTEAWILGVTNTPSGDYAYYANLGFTNEVDTVSYPQGYNRFLADSEVTPLKKDQTGAWVPTGPPLTLVTNIP